MKLNTRHQIFLTSGLILFLELALIRYLPAHISYLGYYSNFILLASFIGMGIGMLLARKPIELEKFFPWALLATAGAASILAVSVYPDLSGEIHFTSSFRGLVIPEFFVVPLVFLLVTFTFATISQRLGKLFTETPPLVAYRWDILGSLSGIASFTLAAYLGLGPIIWFSLIILVFILLTYQNNLSTVRQLIVFAVIMAAIVYSNIGSSWSPYQNLRLSPIPETNDQILYANNIGHQRLEPASELFSIYRTPYELFSSNEPYDHALIIGAGTGNDVAMALSQGVKKITAVEIDPEILKIGQANHPDKPYSDPRVTTYVDDARSFLSKTTDTYDLIIFALPDSVLLASGRGNIRLESFLFTQESFEAAKKHLTTDGLLVLYNWYRRPWLVDKLATMLQNTFNQTPYVTSYSTTNYLAALMVGDKLSDLSPEAPEPMAINTSPVAATDNWPFLYLLKPSLPWIYLIMLTIIGIIIYLTVSGVVGTSLHKKIEPTYFLLGVAFLLLETTALVRFSLLFGTTWLVNSLVFFAVLSLVLIAITLAHRLPHQSLPWWYAGLGLTLLLQYLMPLENLLALDNITKYLSISLLTLLPVFFANIIFSLTFKSSENNDFNFASNILGAGVGGILEYAALMTGYRHLIFVILLCYLAAFLIAKRTKRSTPQLTTNDKVM